ncbi:MAG: hypothetical protein M1820_008623 [Bogoriella megaspora]|nr:MAG: hypothetical protein M1820_008623 [Bogoriella megaspora]
MPGAVKQTKNQRRRQLAKQKKVESAAPKDTPDQSDAESVARTGDASSLAPSEADASDTAAGSYAVQTTATNLFLDIGESDALYSEYRDVFDKFNQLGSDEQANEGNVKEVVFFDNDDDIPDEEEEEAGKKRLSKKKQKEQNKIPISELKARVAHPEDVDWTDADARDPFLLVAMKSYRNTVPVPSHWSLKREYLSSKRGIEKKPFQLPKFIADTGIAEMRSSVLEKQEGQSLKQKQRERVQGKVGKLDIDYQKLYQAFFTFQTKPELTRYGEVYYEGKEDEANHRHLRPGEVSEELKDALNMPPGAAPPWLVNQQRFGAPPSYPALKIPGLNAPPPHDATWGFHAGGYGKPPVDEYNRPLYGGDVYGLHNNRPDQPVLEPIEKTLWGELQRTDEGAVQEDESEDEDEEEEEAGEEEAEEAAGGLETPRASGITSSMPSEYGGTGDFSLRREKRGTETEESAAPRSAYQVLPEQKIQAQGFFGGERAYDLGGRQARDRNLPVLGEETRGKKRGVGDVDVSVDIDALQRDEKLSAEEVKRQYDSKRQEEGRWAGRNDNDDLSEMIAEESRKRQKRDEERRKRR